MAASSQPVSPVCPQRSVRGGLLGLCALRPCRPFLPGPGFRVSVASATDGTRSWAGSGRVQPPDTGFTRERACEPSARDRAHPGPGRLHLRLREPTLETALASAPAGLRRGLFRGPGRAARRAGDPDDRCRGRRHPRSSAIGPSFLGTDDRPRGGWLRCLPGVRSNSLGARGRCRAAAPSPELPRSRTSSLARTPRGLVAGPGCVPRALTRCGLMRGRSPT